MGQVLLVRHGQASWGSEDYDVLSPLGEEQSGVLGSALAARGLRPEVVVRGEMRRHRQTTDAAVAAAGWSVPVVADSGWNEFDHVEVLARHPVAAGAGRERDPVNAQQLDPVEFQQWFDEATDRWTGGEFDADYAEPFTAFAGRVRGALERVTSGLGAGGTAVVFTSGGPIASVVRDLLGGQTHLHRLLAPVVVNASVTRVVQGRRGTTLVSFNDHAHLEAHLEAHPASGDGRLVTYR